jgi:ketosteroid isomerase-like protein
MVRHPEDFHQVYGKTFSAGDLDSIMALYEPTARLIPQPGGPAVTGQAIRDALQGFLALKPTLTVETESAIKTEDIALLRSKWTLTGTGADGKSVTMSHRGTEVIRCQPNGTWRLVIDHPFGAD